MKRLLVNYFNLFADKKKWIYMATEWLTLNLYCIFNNSTMGLVWKDAIYFFFFFFFLHFFFSPKIYANYNARILLMEENSLHELLNALVVWQVSIFFFRALQSKTVCTFTAIDLKADFCTGYYTALEIQVLSMSAIKCWVKFKLFQFASAMCWQKTLPKT